MKNTLKFLFILFSTISFSQEIEGSWTGEVNLNGNNLGFVFHITKNGNVYETNMDIPKQGLNGAEAETTTLEASKLTISFPTYNIVYTGNLKEGEIIGNISSNGQSLPLSLSKGQIELNRPQEPKEPFPYYSEEIVFRTSDNLELQGTLTLPDNTGRFPLVIIISGSGPQNRNGEMFGHKPYLVIADHLTKNGIGVFRYDERGVGASEGNFQNANIDILADDVIQALNQLKSNERVDDTKIGLLGHSIGGIIAPKVFSATDFISFLVLLSAPALDGDELMLSQKANLERKMGLNEMQVSQGQNLVKGAYDIITKANLQGERLKDSINDFYQVKYGAMLPEAQRQQLIGQLTGKEMVSLIQSEPSEYLTQIACPTLAINGDKDFQVSSEENLPKIKSLIESNGNGQVFTHELKNLNHLFQECETGISSEYGAIEQTISPIALNLVTHWIKEQTE